MSLFRKVARAFVVVDEEAPAEATTASDGGGLDEITKDSSTLLAQLDGGSTSRAEPSGGAERGAAELTADDVFRLAGVRDDPNSASRVIKLIAGLAMFPKEQQLTMVRAMDSADESWSEDSVVADARQRVQVLRAHLDNLAQEREQSLTTLTAEIRHSQEAGAAVAAELDRQIAELYARREREAADTATAVARLEQQQHDVRQQEARARQGIAAVIQSLSGLLTFLGAPQHTDRG
ncbi:MAG TPA: hypothetical protein VK509_23700 [Polyangiales bacterium]|nr:hypothetical protein [Polyangiales bacterium]